MPILKLTFVSLILAAVVVLHLVSDALHVRNMTSVAAVVVLYNVYVYLRSKGNVYTFLQPSVIGINYVYISLALGAFAFVSDNIVIPRMRSDATEWLDTGIPIVFLAGVVCLLIALGDHRPKRAAWRLPSPSPARVIALLMLTVGTAFFGSELEIPFVGTAAGATFLIYALHVAALKYGKRRLLLYALALVPLSVLLAHDKRDVIFPLISVVLLEALVRDRDRFTARRVLSWLVIYTPPVLALILVMTVLRAAEQFGITSVGGVIGRRVSLRSENGLRGQSIPQPGMDIYLRTHVQCDQLRAYRSDTGATGKHLRQGPVHIGAEGVARMETG